jgi:hypothetical protein
VNSPIIEDITHLLRDNEEAIGPINAYVFGSTLGKCASPNDVDILVIYKKEYQPRLVRGVLEGIDDRVPLHLTFMLPEEEQETGFISTQHCVPLHLDNHALGREAKLS